MYLPNYMRLVKATLREMESAFGIPYSTAAYALIVGTAVAESDLLFIYQVRGPARGLLQMEPFTAYDLLKYTARSGKRTAALQTLGYDRKALRALSEAEFELRLASDLRLQVILARLLYWRIRAPLPRAVRGLALYWKRYYNTRLGKGVPSKWVARFRLHVAGHLEADEATEIRAEVEEEAGGGSS